MGYITDFFGEFVFDTPLTVKQIDYINAFSASRRMKRDSKVLWDYYAGKDGRIDVPAGKENAEACYGVEGEFYVGDTNVGVLNRNAEASTQAGLRCNWVVSEDGENLMWNGGEKFYNYVEWLLYLRNNFFIPWGKVLNGTVHWTGEDSDDRGKIVMLNNVIEVYASQLIYHQDSVFDVPAMPAPPKQVDYEKLGKEFSDFLRDMRKNDLTYDSVDFGEKVARWMDYLEEE